MSGHLTAGELEAKNEGKEKTVEGFCIMPTPMLTAMQAH